METYWAPDDAAVLGLVKLEWKSVSGWRRGPPKAAYFSVRGLILVLSDS